MKRFLAALVFLLCLTGQVFAAISAATIWELQSGGATTNGGGFVPGLGGTDYTVQAAPQYNASDLVVDAVTNTDVTSATHTFVAADVGNTMQIASGVGYTPGFYQILSIPSAGVARLDRSPAAVGVTSGVYAVGGALTAPEDIMGTTQVAVAGNIINVLEGSYTKTTTRTIGCDSDITGRIYLIGYASGGTRSTTIASMADIAEADMPIFTTATNSVNIFTFTGSTRVTFRNLKITNTAGTKGNGVTTATTRSDYIDFINCIADGVSVGFNLTGTTMSNVQFIRCIGRGSLIGFRCSLSTFVHLWDSTFSGNSTVGMELFTTTSNTINVVMSRVACINNTSHGLAITSTTGIGNTLIVIGGTFAGNGGDGINNTATTSLLELILYNCDFIDNTDDGIEFITASTSGGVRMQNCSFGLNSGTDLVNVVAGNGQIAVTVDPFNNLAGGDYSLNNVTGGGNLLRLRGYPSTLNSGSTPQYIDVGGVQSKPLQTGSSN